MQTNLSKQKGNWLDLKGITGQGSIQRDDSTPAPRLKCFGRKVFRHGSYRKICAFALSLQGMIGLTAEPFLTCHNIAGTTSCPLRKYDRKRRTISIVETKKKQTHILLLLCICDFKSCTDERLVRKTVVFSVCTYVLLLATYLI